MLILFSSIHTHNKFYSYIILYNTQSLQEHFSRYLVNLGINVKFGTNAGVPKMMICFFLSSHPHIKFHFFSSITSIEFQNLIIDSLGSFQKHLKKDVENCDQFFGAWMYTFLVFLACTQQVSFLSILLHFIPEP